MPNLPDELTVASIHHVEDLVIAICNASTTPHQLLLSAHPIWEWACHKLDKSLPELRRDIEAHEARETFATPFLAEKDHLLKLPLILLEHLNRHA